MAARPEAKAKPPCPPPGRPRSARRRTAWGSAAAVVEALVHARRLLCVGAGGVDRRHHRAGGRVGRLAGVDRARGESQTARSARVVTILQCHSTCCAMQNECLGHACACGMHREIHDRLMLPPQITDHVDPGDQAVKALVIGHDRHVARVENRQKLLDRGLADERFAIRRHELAHRLPKRAGVGS